MNVSVSLSNKLLKAVLGLDYIILGPFDAEKCVLDLSTGTRANILPLEPENPSNDDI